jgi:hypothetical protein
MVFFLFTVSQVLIVTPPAPAVALPHEIIIDPLHPSHFTKDFTNGLTQPFFNVFTNGS